MNRCLSMTCPTIPPASPSRCRGLNPNPVDSRASAPLSMPDSLSDSFASRRIAQAAQAGDGMAEDLFITMRDPVGFADHIVARTRGKILGAPDVPVPLMLLTDVFPLIDDGQSVNAFDESHQAEAD